LGKPTTVTMSSLELKVPPPLVALCGALLMWLASFVVASIEVPFLLRVSGATALAFTGLGFIVAGLVSFMRAKTTVNSTKPTSTTSLVSTGVYRFTRNPMYLGLLLVLLGWATFLANAVPFLIAPLFVLYINRFQITPEERTLASMFGAEFSAYRESVRRWL
ncbi:MAG: methyltransferase family protein, partial [Terriglobia bacterium]